MTEYIERQAAITACEYTVDEWTDFTNGFNAGVEHDKDAIKKLPSADVEPVVRCKDCVFGNQHFDWVRCRNPYGLDRDVSCDGYCSAGIKYEGENGR